MTLTLSIRNFDRLANGTPTELVLHRRGALVGRSNICDWSLPDPRSYISSRHCEVSFADDGFYYLIDISTNGTFLNGSDRRMAEPRRIEHGDQFQIGHYEVLASLSGEAAAAAERAAAEADAASRSGWAGWDAAAGSAPAAAAGQDGRFSAPRTPDLPPASAWSESAGPTPSTSAWTEAASPMPSASAWSSPAPDRPPTPSPQDVWGQLADGNVVDWARGGFGQPIEERPDPLGLGREPRESLGGEAERWDSHRAASPSPARSPISGSFSPPRTHDHDPPESRQPAAPAPQQARTSPLPSSPSAPPAISPEAVVGVFLKGAGIDTARVKDLTPATLDRAGQLFRRLVAGLVVMIEARARAKSQMGAEATMFVAHGNNPIKFARTPEAAVAALLHSPERGFIDASAAIDDAFLDLQSHQMATLKAMQGALRATLERFSPSVISQRAEEKGLLEKIIPAARSAALWHAYEKEFSGVAKGSDEAFMDVFAKEFRKAYADLSQRG